MARSVVLLFIKYPEPGRVKTRFASEAGKDAALELYRLLVDRLMKMLTGGHFPVRICYAPATASDEIAAWLGRDHCYQPQLGDGLGERMKAAFQDMFSEGAERALLIGSDVPGLSPEILDEALRSLETSDVVIGPARDGGYYLIGFTAASFKPEVFDGIPWSTNAVFAETSRIVDSAGLHIHHLPILRDIDTLEDLQHYVLANRARYSAAMDPLQSLLDRIERGMVSGH